MTTRNRVLIVHGVNLDMLGRRPAAIYGGMTFDHLEQRIAGFAHELNLEPRFFQTNHEGALVEHLHRADDRADAILINPGAWTHYSYAIRDAVELLPSPVVEVHLSNILEREEWRRHSVIEEVVAHRVLGRGPEGYREALAWLAERR